MGPVVTEGTPQDRFRHLRWTGTLAVVSGALGLTGNLLIAAGYFDISGLRSAWLTGLPWIAVIAFGLLVRFLRGFKSAGASLGLAVVGAVLAGPAFLMSAARLRWMNEPGLWPSPASSLRTVSDDAAEWLLTGGLTLTVVAAVLLVASCWIPVARAGAIPGNLVPRSPYRIETLALIVVLVVVAFSTSRGDWAFFGTYSTFAHIAILLSWIVPLSVVLGLGLRSNGLGSLWVATGLAVAVVVEPVARFIGLTIWSTLGWNDAPDDWYQEGALTTGSLLIPTAASAWIILPVLAIIGVIVLWNSTSRLIEGPFSHETPRSAPLDPWAGTAFVLSFVPVISVPALILGHISYERVVTSDQPLRGRVIAATAIVLGLLNIAVVVLVASGATSTFGDLWIGG